MKKREKNYISCYLHFKQIFKVFAKLLPSKLTVYTERFEGSFVTKILLNAKKEHIQNLFHSAL